MGRRRALRRFLRQPVAMGATVLLGAVLGVGAAFPQFAPVRPNFVDLSTNLRNHPPMWSGWHLWGTNAIGQDILTRSLWGLHATEQSALVATGIALFLGLVAGGLSGYYGGWIDAVVMRVGDMLGVFPALMLMLGAALYFQPLTVWRTAFVFGCFLWIPVARIVRAEIDSLSRREFVEAAVSIGASNRRIFFRHLLPHARGSLILAATSVLGQVLLLEATIEFFGVGVPSEEVPTLGNLLGDAQASRLDLSGGWWTVAGPAVVLSLLLVCANLIGDGVADALRPSADD